MDHIGMMFCFLGRLVERRTTAGVRALQFACSKWTALSAGVLKLAQDLWCGQESSRPSMPDFVIIDGHVADCRAPSKGPSIAKENAIITLDEKDTVQKDDSSSDTTTVASIVCDSIMTDGEDGTKQQEKEEKEDEAEEEEMFTVAVKRGKRAKKGHNGMNKSSKKKGRKGRAAYTLRGVNGEVATPP